MNQNSTGSVNIFEQISQICREFRKQISRGKTPKIEQHLTSIPEDGLETLFSNLLEIEINFRQRNGEQPTTNEYLKRFPQFAKQVRRAFFEPTLASYDSSVGGDGETQSLQVAAASPNADTFAFEVPAANRLGEYELIRELGRGGMGVVYEARHTKTNNRVALKTLPTGGQGQEVNAEKLYRFRKEFRSLSEINHPNLVGMQTLEVDGSQWFFTMDLIDGEDFLSYVRPDGELNEQRLRSCLEQLARGIIALHRERIVHRDLKPSNVLVSADGRVAILDFGLAAEMQRTQDMTRTKSGMFAGTPRYAAPEQMFGERTEASDWYAFGTMLYEALVGEPPFTAKDQMQLLKDKQNLEAPLLSGRSDMADDLAQITDGLIRREPNERMNAESVTNLLDLHLDTRTGGSTAGSQGSSGSVLGEELDLESLEEEEIVLIGREKQLAQLESIKDTFLETRQPKVVWIIGLSGEGKSSLAETFLRPLRRGKEFLVLSGRCYDRESVPFKAIDSIIDSLARYLRSLSEQHIRKILPADIEMLAHLFPLLNRVPAIATQAHGHISSLDSRQIRYRAFGALGKLFDSIGEQTPVVLMIDDLQWGDADSALALHTLICRDQAPPVLLMGTCRSDEMEESSFCREWSQQDRERETSSFREEIALQPLDLEQCITMVSARTGMSEADARESVQKLFDSTQGNPYLVDQLIEGFNVGAENWQPTPLNEIVAEKLRRLPAGSEKLLKFVAIAGKATQANELSYISETGTKVLSLLTHMRSERLVRLVGSGDGQLVDTWHDKIRETVLEQMGMEQRNAIHLQFGEFIESREELSISRIQTYLQMLFTSHSPPEFSTARVFDLAFHFQLAGDPRAFHYQFMAGELAYQNYASEEAREYFVRVCELLSGGEPARFRSRLWHRLATSSRRLTKFDEAIEQFDAGVGFAEPGMERASFYVGIARIHQTRTRYDLATKYHDLALSEIDHNRPRGLLAHLVTLYDLAKLIILPETFLRKPTALSGDQQRFVLSIYTDLSQFLFDCYIPLIDYPATVVRLAILSHRGKTDGFSPGLAMAASHFALSGLPRLGKRLASTALRRIDSKIDVESEGVCHYGAGVAFSYSSDFEESEREFDKSISLLLKSGAHHLAAPAMHLKRHLLESVSSASEEVKVARQLIALTNSSGDLRSLLMGHYDHAGGLARFGMIDESFRAIEKAHDIWKLCIPNTITPIYFANRGFVFLQASLYESARDVAEVSWIRAIRHLRMMDVCLRGLPWYLESVAGPDWSLNPTPVNRRVVRRRCRIARLLAAFHPKIRPHLLRSRGRAFTVLGKRQKSIKELERAVSCARKLGMPYDLAKSLLDLSAVKEAKRDENRAEAIRLLKEMESVIPRAESWLLGDQYDESVVAPEFDLKAWEEKNGPIAVIDGDD